MNVQNYRMIADSLLKVANSAPNLDGPTSYFQQNPFTPPNMRSDVTKAEFDAWVQYVNQTLDIAQKYTNQNVFFNTKVQISQLNLNDNILYIHRIRTIQQILIELSQQILNYN